MIKIYQIKKICGRINFDNDIEILDILQNRKQSDHSNNDDDDDDDDGKMKTENLIKIEFDLYLSFQLYISQVERKFICINSMKLIMSKLNRQKFLHFNNLWILSFNY